MKHFKKFDFFGEKFSFNYNGYDKYSTRVGGLIFLIFILVTILFFINSFIIFYKRKNYSLQFYTVNHKTENITLNNSFAFGIECNSKEGNKYFDTIIEYYTKINGKKKNIIVDTKNCNDFENENNLSENINNNMHNLKIDDFKCINNENIIRGIYTDEKFLYYKITVTSKKNQNITEIYDYLLKYECKLQFYYKDYIFDIKNYKKPDKLILNSLFLQINPYFEIKKNVFFMKYHFSNDDQLIDFSFFKDNNKDKEYLGFSRIEDYFIYNNNTLNGNESKNFTSLYLRADNRKTQIIRKYQNLLDFYAENTSFWIGVFEFLNIFFTIYNGFHANLSMSKKLFFFDEVKKDNKYNILRKDSLKLNISNTILRKGNINSNDNTKNVNIVNEISINDITNNNIDNNNDDKKNTIAIYSQKKYNINPSEKTLNSEEDSNINISKKSTIQIDENNNKNNYISLYEVIKISSFTYCKCCVKNIKYKEKIIKEAMDIFDKKLDIYIYTKNMILIDIMYQILMNDLNKDYVNFLSRSLIYLNKKEEKESKELEAIYEPTTKLNSDYSNKLYEEFNNLIEKKDKTEIEKKIIKLYKNS